MENGAQLKGMETRVRTSEDAIRRSQPMTTVSEFVRNESKRNGVGLTTQQSSTSFALFSLAALGGSLVSTIAVILSGHWPAILVVLGFVVGVSLYTWVLRVFWRFAWVRERFVGWFSKGCDNHGPAVHSGGYVTAGAGQPVKQGTGHRRTLGEVIRPSASSGQLMPGNRDYRNESDPLVREFRSTGARLSNRAGNSKRSRPVFGPRRRDGGYGRTRPVGNRFRERGDVGPSPWDEENASLPIENRSRNASERERGKRANISRQPRRAPTYNNPNPPMLRPVEQDVLSALMNLGCSFKQAHEAVESVSDGRGESFDQLFRKALDAANSRKMLSRKAVA
jgi:hypothetical protein